MNSFLPMVFAILISGHLIAGVPKAHAQATAEIEADALNVDESENIIRAIGNVEVHYLDHHLRADKIVWSRDTDSLVARGNVILTEKDGTRLNAERMVLRDALRAGVIDGLTILLPTDGSFTATQAQRANTITTLEDATYTACQPCNDSTPSWTIRAQKIIHDKSRRTITYRHARLELGGVPIIYLPWFQNYTADVKKHSGILIPQIRSQSTFGLSLSLPIFWNIAPNYDLTFTPVFTSKQGIIWTADWRHKTQNGNYYMSLISTRPSGNLNRLDGIHDTRIGLYGGGEFDIGDWTIGFQLREPGDDLFFYRYDVDRSTILESNLNATHRYTSSTGNGVVTIEFFRYRYVLGNEDGSTVDNILPNIAHVHQFDEPVLGGSLSFESKISYAQRKRGLDIARTHTRLDWNRRFEINDTLTFDLQNRTQVDAYFFNSNASDQDYQAMFATTPEIFARTQQFLVASAFSVTAAIPLYRTRNGVSESLTPQVQIVVASDNDGYDQILYRTTVEFDLTSASIFGLVDPEDEASRINVGMSYKATFLNGLETIFSIGQSYNLTNRAFTPESGLTDGSSNIVTYFEIKHEGISFDQNMRLDNHDGAILRYDAELTVSRSNVDFSLGYFSAAPHQVRTTSARVEEVRTRARIKFNNTWSFTAEFRRDLERHRATRHYIDFNYKNDCTTVKLSFERDNRQVRTVEAETTFRLEIILRTLGAIRI